MPAKISIGMTVAVLAATAAFAQTATKYGEEAGWEILVKDDMGPGCLVTRSNPDGATQVQMGIDTRQAPKGYMAIYTKAVRTAFREVYDSLVAQRSLREAVAARQAELQAREKALELAGLRYEAGYVGYLEVIDSQRFLFATQQQELELRRTALQNAVDLMLALGGGWEDAAADGE